MKKDVNYFDLKLSESKELLNHINQSIKETRNRIYFFIALIFAIFGFSIDDFLKSDYYSIKSFILYSIIIFGGFILYHCRYAITPLKLRFNGISPDNFDNLINKNDEKTKRNIFYTYQKSIDINGSHLTKMAKGYNISFYSILIWLFFVTSFIIIKIII